MNDSAQTNAEGEARRAIAKVLSSRGVGRRDARVIEALLRVELTSNKVTFSAPELQFEVAFQFQPGPGAIQAVALQAASMLMDDLSEELGRRGIADLAVLVDTLTNESGSAN
jgi:hypothetical protein